MLSFASHELGEWRENSINNPDFTDVSARSKTNAVKILAEKIRVPRAASEAENAAVLIRRPRLFAHLKKSLAHFSATLLTGRTGTGKTALAAEFARSGLESGDFDCVAWYKPDATDADWTVFSSYLNESLEPCKSASDFVNTNRKNESESVTNALAARFAALDPDKSFLIVIDNLHAVFDAAWFGEFFNALLSLPAPNVRLLLLARSQPSFPLLRLRSKHALDLVDEKLLAFTPDETVEFFKNYKLSPNAAKFAHKSAYGRIAKLKAIAEKKR